MRFREKVMKKISSPDDMDVLLCITTPVSWIAVLTIFVLLAAMFVWGIFGSVPLSISGNGMLMYSGGVVKVSAPVSGMLKQWQFYEGDKVFEGEDLVAIYESDVELQMAKIENDLKFTASNSQQYLQLMSELKNLMNKANNQAVVVAPVGGTIIDVMRNSNQSVKAGETIAEISTGSSAGNLQAMVYVNGANAKRLKVNMPVRIELGNIRADKYGYLMGQIERVSTYPMTAQSIAETLGNETLTPWMTGGGQTVLPVFEVVVRLVPDALTQSGYAWTTANGPAEKISAGTPLSAACVVERRRPIELVFEWLKNFFGGE